MVKGLLDIAMPMYGFLGLRPIVCLNNNVQLTKVENGYEINN